MEKNCKSCHYYNKGYCYNQELNSIFNNMVFDMAMHLNESVYKIEAVKEIMKAQRDMSHNEYDRNITDNFINICYTEIGEFYSNIDEYISEDFSNFIKIHPDFCCKYWE